MNVNNLLYNFSQSSKWLFHRKIRITFFVDGGRPSYVLVINPIKLSFFMILIRDICGTHFFIGTTAEKYYR